MTEPVITCPDCGAVIPLTESLAAPLIAATRRQYEKQLADQAAEVATREQERRLADAQTTLDTQVAEQVSARLVTEHVRVASEESLKAKRETAAELDAKSRELADLNAVLKSRDEKLAEAQNAQAELIKKQRELDDARRELELTVEKRIQEGLETVRSAARQEAEDGMKLKVMEKDHTITSMQETIAELKHKAEQGSQQLQGEVQELELENLLRAKFPLDAIEPVAKGEFGGDVLQRVVGPGGQQGGSILRESKRTKNWSDGWLTKLREDQRTAKAEVSVLVSQVLPKGIETFDVVDGVWVTSPRAALPVATVLRQTLLQVSLARHVTDGQQTKTEMVYQYLTGPRFRHRVEAMVEAFSSMKEDLDKERKAINKQWAKREEQSDRVMPPRSACMATCRGSRGSLYRRLTASASRRCSDLARPPSGVARVTRTSGSASVETSAACHGCSA